MLLSKIYKHISRLIVAATLMAVALPVLAIEPVPGGADSAKRAAAARWADSVYSTLSVRERFAQLMMPKVVPTSGVTSKTAIRRYVQAGVGGLLFTEGTLAQYVEMTNYAQSVAKIPVLMTFDGEWGLSMRIRELPKFPTNMAIGAIQDPMLVYRYGAEMGRQCRLIGVQCNFAPDADVNSNPANPVIGYRSFGEDPQRVATATVAYSLGMEDGGVQCTPKHFPGHGDTHTDSHMSVTVVDHSRALLDSTDLVPFRESINAGISGIMIGHLVVPALDPNNVPASLSKRITTDFLRGELGYEGLIYTDALGMKGAADPQGRNSTLAALDAGADVLLGGNDTYGALQVLENAYQNGTISEAVLADRCKRLLRYKYYLGLNHKPLINTNIDELRAELSNAQTEALIQELSNACITVLRNEGNVLPIGELSNRSVAVVTIGQTDNADIFTQTCAFYAQIKKYHSEGGAFSQQSLQGMRNADVVIVGIFDDKPTTRETFAQVAAQCGGNKLVAAFMVNAYKMKKFSASFANVKGLILGYDDIPQIARSAAEAAFGGIEVTGKLPVQLRGLAPLGAGIDLRKSRLGFASPVSEGFAPWLADSLTTFAKKCMRVGAFPGCQILVARNGNVVYDKSFGRIGDAQSAEVTANTVYDLASVSKATGTLSGVMKAYDQGLINLDDTLGHLIPEIADTAKQCISVRQLLYHESGMPAALNMYKVMIDSNSFAGKLITTRRDADHTIRIGRKAYGHRSARLRDDIVKRTRSSEYGIEAARGLYVGRSAYDTIMRRIYDIPLRPTRKFNYSCLNFCLLMDIEQRATGRAHDEYVRTEVFGPLGAYRTGYRPLTWLTPNEIAVTENDTFLRRQTVHGYVHDETANFSGGVQGNAGLFANARDIAKYSQMLLNGGLYGDARILSEGTTNLFLSSKSPTCRRGLGFDKPDTENPDNSPTCEEAGAAVVGHLGFTGTVFWIDRSENLIFVFLTNRVYPTRETPVFNSMDIRPHLFSLVYQALEDRN